MSLFALCEMQHKSCAGLARTGYQRSVWGVLWLPQKYEEAAELHQRVGVLERNDPILRRRQRLAQCIAEEIYQVRAVHRVG